MMMRLFPLNHDVLKEGGESVMETQEADSTIMLRRPPKGESKKSSSSKRNSKPNYRNAGPSNARTTKLKKRRKPREEVAERMYKAARERKNVVAVTIH